MKINGTGLGKWKKGSTPPQMKISATGKTGKDCKRKQKFFDKIEADLHALMYNNQRALMFSPVEAYHCPKHDCWHIGHSFEKMRVKK
tara:strand:- start:104 stop:364 length:261 start_codon:yes stop_codon:yes gene_type:complete